MQINLFDRTYLLKAEKLKLYECPFQKVENVLSACISVENVHHPNGVLHNLCDGVEFIFQALITDRFYSVERKGEEKTSDGASATVRARVEVISTDGAIFHEKRRTC
jgi:hypothetical protein